MKIHIIGGPGSGKTFLAKKLSKELGIHHYDLDDLQWDNHCLHCGNCLTVCPVNAVEKRLGQHG